MSPELHRRARSAGLSFAGALAALFLSAAALTLVLHLIWGWPPRKAITHPAGFSAEDDTPGAIVFKIGG